MSNRTWACIDCGKTYRRDQLVRAVRCAVCREPCEYVHWKIHVPSPRRARDWRAFWSVYLREKRLLEQFLEDPTITSLRLDLLNQTWVRR